MKKIYTYILKYWYRYVFILACLGIAATLDMLYPLITKEIVNKVFLGGDFSVLGKLLAGIVVVGVGKGVFGYLKEYTADVTGVKIGVEMRKELYNHIQGLSMDYFHRTNTGELMARIKDDVDHIWQVIGFVGIMSIEVVVNIIMVLYCMFRLNWVLTFVPMIFMIVCGYVAIHMERKMDVAYSEISQENAELTTVAEENLAGVRTVKAFAREDYEIEKFLAHNQKFYSLNMKQAKLTVKYDPIFQFVGKILPVICTILGGVYVIKGQMDIGSLVAYVEYTRKCTWPTELLGWIVNDVSSAIASRKKIRKIFAEVPMIAECENPVILEKVKGEVAFENVSLDIEGTPVLHEVSFDVKPGKTLGIMGATGSGKTSVINLMQRFYDPSVGTVRLDGEDVKNLSFEQVRGSIACVMQDVFLFSDTIEENIKMGQRDSLSMENIKKAAQLACADEFIEETEDAYETVIGERGVGLSGGQKQRISIARALAKKSPILILDDSTSALDMETEQEIQHALKQLDGVTKIIVAHRVSSVKHADEILVLENGYVLERGTHEQLMEKKGRYYDTCQNQYAAMKGGEAYGC